MFLSVFETFIGLLSLYNYSASIGSNYSYYTMEAVTYEEVHHTIDDSAFYRYDSYSGTSVTFNYESSGNLDYLYYPSTGYYTESIYRIYSSIGSNYHVVGSLHFSIDRDSNTDTFRMKCYYQFNDIYNIKINVLFFDYDNQYSNALVINGKYVTPGEGTTYYSPYFSQTFDDFFYEDDNELFITIQTQPVSDEEWSGTWSDGYDEGYTNGKNEGYQNGYTDGYTEGAGQNSTATTIFTGIISVGLMPINFFLGILNFEVFGINIGGLVAGFLTIAVTLIIVRIIFSGGNGKGDSK